MVDVSVDPKRDPIAQLVPGPVRRRSVPQDPEPVDEYELEAIAALQSDADRPATPPPAQAVMSFAASHGACTASWAAPLYVKIELDRFGDDRGELRAEVVVRYTAPGLERQLLAPRRVPLLGTRAHTDMVRDLATRMRDVDWRDLLEQAFTEAIRAHREGEPAVSLPDVPVRLAARYALKPLALQELLTVVWSRPGEGKTWIACAAAVALQTGRGDVLGLAPARPMRVGILDWEDDAFTKAERARAIAGQPVPAITYIACRGAIWDELDRIVRIVRERELEYLILDSLGMACGGLPPESSEAALRCGTAIRRIGLGTLATAHIPKNGQDESAPFGSVFWLAQLRLGWFLKRDQEASESGFRLGLFCKKSNNDRAPAPLAFDVAFDAGRARFARRDVRDVPELATRVPLRWRLQGALKAGPRLIHDVAEELEEKPDTIGRTLRRYVDRDFVRLPGPDGVDRWANLARDAS